MTVLVCAVVALVLISVAATIRAVVLDGYRRVPTRQGGQRPLVE